MSSSVGRNSLIMASGTLASRVTGQFRTILLAACLGTTGVAANAYQTGAMIPQVLFTVISGGICASGCAIVWSRRLSRSFARQATGNPRPTA